jgi:outer membrane protein assembly factor BamD (BamD/ComL family)
MKDKSQAIKTMRASMLFKKHLIELDKKNFDKAREYLLEINKIYE